MTKTHRTITQKPAVLLHAQPKHEKYDRHRIKCVETGEIFESAAAAAHSLGCGRSAMSNHLSGRFPHIRGKHFVRIEEAE